MPATVYAAQSLLTALSAVLGEQLTLDRDGQCTLLFADDVEIAMADSPDGLLSLCAPLMPVGHGAGSDAVLRSALTLNHAQLPPGCTISFDEHGNQLVLLALLWTERVSADAFLECIGGMVELVPQLRTLLSAPPAAAPGDSMQLPNLRA